MSQRACHTEIPQAERQLAAQRAIVVALGRGDLHRALREHATAPAVRRYQQLRDQFIRLGIRVVEYHVGRLAAVAAARGIDRGDLHSVGLFALMRAADRLDPNKARYSTYADHCVRSMLFALLCPRKRRPELEFRDEIKVGDEESPEAYAQAVDLAEALAELATRSPKAAEVLRGRLRGESHSEIGRRLGFAKERSRALEQREIPRLQKALRRSA